MAVFQKFLVGQLLGFVDCGGQKAHNTHGIVTGLMEVDANMPRISVLADCGFSFTVMDSSELLRIMHCRERELTYSKSC